MPHKKLQHLMISKFLELLHMDLITYAGKKPRCEKKYVLMCMEDFSRCTWTNLIKEKIYLLSWFQDMEQSVHKMKSSFKIRLEGRLTFFLCLQVKQQKCIFTKTLDDARWYKAHQSYYSLFSNLLLFYSLEYLSLLLYLNCSSSSLSSSSNQFKNESKT